MPAGAGLNSLPPLADETTAPDRLPLLDLIRGVAVLGILAVNLGGFAGPIAATLSPHVPLPGTVTDEAWFALMLVVFEGKMRALFTLLFGASMLLFIDRADARGADGERLQLRRLGWLAVIGYLHFVLLWWGDILFTYAVAGLVAVVFRQAPPRALAAMGLLLFTAWHLGQSAQGWPPVARELQVIAGTAPPAERLAYTEEQQAAAGLTQREMAGYHRGFVQQAAAKLRDQPGEPLQAALATMGESLPLMLIGMALFCSGFFALQWPRRRLVWLAGLGIGSGGIATALFTGWAWSLHFPPVLMLQALAYGLALPHLAMSLGYAAVLVLAAPRLLTTRLGRRLIAAGRMALSNYLGMSVVMTALFYGWGLDLIGGVPERWLWLFLCGGWVLMLGWSQPWLTHVRHGPVEWVWRTLTLAQPVAFSRSR